jgi:hypothetical protein
MAHGFIVTARSNTVSISSLCARLIISWVEVSIDASIGSASLTAFAFTSAMSRFLLLDFRDAKRPTALLQK